MSETSITDGGEVTKDKDAELVYVWDWSADLAADAQIVTSTWIISGPDAALTYDSADILPGGKQTRVRLIGGTNKKRYTVTNRYVTNSTPTEKDDASITVRIGEQ